MKLKTKAWPDGRDWPDELTLDVGSNMPMDVYAIHPQHFGVLYVRHDIATKREQKARLDALREAEKAAAKNNDGEMFEDGLSADLHESGIETIPAAYRQGKDDAREEIREAILARIKEVEG